MKALSVYLLLCVASALPEVLSWEDWLDAFNGNDGLFLDLFSSPDLDIDRKKIYMDNVDFIKKHNARHDLGLESFRLGVNQFSAMSHEEWSSSVTGCLLPRKRPATNSTEVVRGEILRRRINTQSKSIDWREKNVVTAVKNQGACGSCWSFSTTGAVEVAVALESGNLISLSEQQLMDCARAEGEKSCEGGLMDGAFEYVIKNHGLDSEADYPYEMMDDSCKKDKEHRHVATIKSFHDVSPNDEVALAQAVQIGAVSVAIEADQRAFMNYRSGVFTADCGTNLDHGVLVVGYGTSEDGLDYWIVKNSWGTEWGEQGYMLMERNIEDPSGKCGIASQPSFPLAGPQPKPQPTKKPTTGPPVPAPIEYERPVDGACHSGEIASKIQDVSGSICLPKCKHKWIIFETCPEVPVGVNAEAECLFEMSDGTMLCGLVCDLDDTMSCRPGDGCRCRDVQGKGICTYDDE